MEEVGMGQDKVQEVEEGTVTRWEQGQREAKGEQ